MSAETQPDPAAAFVFDPNAPEFLRNPFTTFAYLRTQAPIYYWQAGRSWLVTRHDDVSSVLRDKRLTTDQRRWAHAPAAPPEGPFAQFARMVGSGLASASPEAHARLRRLLNPAFTPSAIERMRGRVQQIVNTMLDAALRGDTVDIRNDFAESLPIRVIGSVLAIPERDDAQFRSFALSLIQALNPFRPREQAAQHIAVVLEGTRPLEATIEARRQNLGDDLLSDLLRAEEAGNRLSRDELVGFIIGLLIAGSDTTVHAICFAVYEILRHPEVLARVRADRSLLKNAIEESLRHNVFMKYGTLPRYTLEAIELRGTTIGQGERVLPLVSATLHDPAVHANPETFDLHRADASAALVFGIGPHYCLGAALARLELHVTLGTLLDRYPRIELIDREPEFRPNLQMRDMVALRLEVGA